MKTWRQSAILRKGARLAGQIPRFYARYLRHDGVDAAPPVLANSFPKSGTHLLTQIVGALPPVRGFGTFLASLPSVTMRERSDESVRRVLRSAPPGEMISAHLFHKPAFEALVEELGFASFFIYRDPRDVVCSEAHYLTHMNPWHRMHGRFLRAGTDDERVALAICGLPEGEADCEYEDVGRRFRRYAGWLQHPSTLAVRFEDLAGPDREPIVERIVNHFLVQRSNTDGSAASAPIVKRALEAIRPSSSHTYREGGGPGTWRQAFSDRHRRLFKAHAGDLLIELGYESGTDW